MHEKEISGTPNSTANGTAKPQQHQINSTAKFNHNILKHNNKQDNKQNSDTTSGTANGHYSGTPK